MISMVTPDIAYIFRETYGLIDSAQGMLCLLNLTFYKAIKIPQNVPTFMPCQL